MLRPVKVPGNSLSIPGLLAYCPLSIGASWNRLSVKMPVTDTIEGPRGAAFWDTFDPNDNRLVAETLKEEVCLIWEKRKDAIL